MSLLQNCTVPRNETDSMRCSLPYFFKLPKELIKADSSSSKKDSAVVSRRRRETVTEDSGVAQWLEAAARRFVHGTSYGQAAVLSLVTRHSAAPSQSPEACCCGVPRQNKRIDEFVCWLHHGQIYVAHEHHSD